MIAAEELYDDKFNTNVIRNFLFFVARCVTLELSKVFSTTSVKQKRHQRFEKSIVVYNQI